MSPRFLRINVGCGASATPGWLNLDNSWSVRLAALGRMLAPLLPANRVSYLRHAKALGVRYGDATKRLPVRDGTVQVIYACHIVEHLDQGEIAHFLREAKRALFLGGILRLVVPSLAYHIEEYRKTGDADAFMAYTHLGRVKPKGFLATIERAVTGDRGHHWMYDGPSLVALLTRHGFHEAKVVPMGTTTIRNPEPLDLWERAGESVAVEAVR